MAEHTESHAVGLGRIVVSGGTGLIGSVLVPTLVANGNEVYVITRDVRRVPAGAIPIVTDITDRNWVATCRSTLPEIDHLIWMAYAQSGKTERDRQITYSSLVQLMEAIAVRNVLFVGSTGVYGQDPAPGIYTEQSEKVGDTAYARDKIAAIGYLQKRSDVQSITVLNPSIVYSRDSSRVKYYSKLLATGYLLYEKTGSGFYNIVHNHDAADAIARALGRRAGARFEEYILNGETIELRNWIGTIEKWCHYQHKTKIPPVFYPLCRGPVRRLLAPLGFRLPARMPTFKAQLFEKQIVYSSDKIRQQLGWVPRRILPESLA